MIVELVEVAVLGGQESPFEAALCDVRQSVFMSKGFRGFTVAQGVERPARYLVQVLWETEDEQVDFAQSGRFARCWAPVEPFLAGPLRIEHFAQRPGLTFRGPGVITDFAGCPSGGGRRHSDRESDEGCASRQQPPVDRAGKLNAPPPPLPPPPTNKPAATTVTAGSHNVELGAPSGTRTPNPLIKRAVVARSCTFFGGRYPPTEEQASLNDLP
jgi:heme-degrading monooxygenase HmoA